MRQILVIGWKELGDRTRSGWVIACILVWLGAVVLTSVFGLVQVGQIGWQGFERTVASLLNLTQYLVPLLALLLGHDLIAHEAEDRTLALLIASGVSRSRVLLGKWVGGILVLTLTLGLGFGLAGALIALTPQAGHAGPFIRLAATGFLLGVVFLSIGLLISACSATRVQALVVALLAWGVAVFVFDLVALGVLVTTQASAAGQEIEFNCEATHQQGTGDIHQEADTAVRQTPHRMAHGDKEFIVWLLLNPVDLFRVLNVSAEAVPGIRLGPTAVAALLLWLGAALELGRWRFSRREI